MQITITTEYLANTALAICALAVIGLDAYMLILNRRLRKSYLETQEATAHDLKKLEEMRQQDAAENERQRSAWRLFARPGQEQYRDHATVVPILKELSRLEGDNLTGAVVIIGTKDTTQLRFYAPGVTLNMGTDAYVAGPHREMLQMLAKSMVEAERVHQGTLAVLTGMLDEQRLLLEEAKSATN